MAPITEVAVKRGPRIEMKVGADRRAPAPHPGPIIRRDYMEPLGIDVPTLAGHVGIDPSRLEALLDGRISFTVDVAVRLARALGLPPERLMQMQVRYDFSEARAGDELNRIDVIGPSTPQPFPQLGFIRGRLGKTSDPFGDGSLYFQDDLAPKIGTDRYAGFHALWRGDRLRIYDADGAVIWTGPVLQNLDGRILLPYVRGAVWHSWFDLRYRADLSIGEEHAAFFQRMRDA